MTEAQEIMAGADFEDAVEARLQRLAAEHVVERVWKKDHTVWTAGPEESADRLGWLTAPDAMLSELEALEAFASAVWEAGFTTAVLMGMGGSSLAPEVLQQVLASAPNALQLIVLDTTHPAELLATSRSLDLDRTLFIASSKSGSTIETRSQLEYFWGLRPEGSHYVAITDEGSALHTLAEGRGFRHVFLNDPEVGGRYSALTYFGMVPGALIGADIRSILVAARQAARATRDEDPAKNVATRAGVEMGLSAEIGRDKLTIVGPAHLRPFGWWLEQLLSESTGKDGTGILPVEGETGRLRGSDRMFVDFGPGARKSSLTRHPGPLDWWNWEFATAIAGHVLGLNPFDQPAVQQAKDATAAILAGTAVDAETPEPAEIIASAGAGNYIALLAYLPRTHANDARLSRIRTKLGEHCGVATTSGFGPRYLHSTGQYHKGGPNTGIFIEITGEIGEDVAIPGADYTFGELNAAQALGDLQSLRSLGRRVARTTLEELEHYCAGL